MSGLSCVYEQASSVFSYMLSNRIIFCFIRKKFLLKNSNVEKHGSQHSFANSDHSLHGFEVIELFIYVGGSPKAKEHFLI